MAGARAGAGSSDRLAFEERPQRIDLVPAGESEEAFLRRDAVREISLEHALDGLRRILGFDVVVDLGRDRRVWAETAADVNVVALDRVAVFGGLHFAGQQSDVADVMLRAGVMASGEMDVDRAVERDAAFAPARDLLGMPLGVGGGELATDIAGAGDEPRANRVRAGGQAERFDPRLRRLHIFRMYARDDQVLPDGEPNIAVAEVTRDLREPTHLFRGHLADWQDDADPIAVGLLLCTRADMSGAIERRARRERVAGDAVELAAELFLDQRQHLVETQPVDDVFESRLGAVGAIAMIDEHAHDGVGHLGGVGGLDHHAGVAREVLVPGNAADDQTKPRAGRNLAAVLHLDRLEADVVGILEHGNDAAAVEADIELARQAVERALVEDVEMPFARVGPRVDQLLRIDARGGRTRDVANIVGARAARAQPEILHRLDNGDGVLGLDLAHLEVGAGGDMGIAAAVALGEIGDAGKLPVREDAVRHAQPAHIRVLIGRDVEQAEEAPAEIVRRLGIFVVRRLRLEAFVAVEGMQLALEFLLLGELAAGGEDAILRAQMRGVGAARLRRLCSPAGGSAGALARGLGDLQAGDETFEVTLLLGVEIARHGLRSAPF